MNRQQAIIALDDRVRVGTVIISIVACLLVAAPPLFLRLGFPHLALWIYSGLAPVCHQMPERAFHWLGFPLALCARCIGLLWGFTLGAVWSLRRWKSDRPPLPHRAWILSAAWLMLLDILAPFWGIYENTHLSRATTGALFGLASALTIEIGIAELCEILGNAWKRKALA